jgi:tyrosine-specific transport protein
MRFDFRLIGSILMILGTSIGVGMLALPVAASYQNFSYNTVLLLSAWLLMTVGAFALLEVNLWFPAKANLVSMAHGTLGRCGKYVAWTTYLLLLYSVLCAYIAGSSDVLQTLFHWMHMTIPHWAAALLSVVILGSIVYGGVYAVDISTRILMTVKLLAYFLMIGTIVPRIHLDLLLTGDNHFRISPFMVMITSFGYAIIIPSLRTYLKSKTKSLHQAIVIGSLVPLLIYFLWMLSIQGLIPKDSSDGLIAISQSKNAIGQLMITITACLRNPWVNTLASTFISICAATSFLGVGLCLVDFITDGLKLHHHHRTLLRAHLMTFVPPTIIVLWCPGIFIHALSYAGVFCLILLALFPLLMLYSGRHLKKLSKEKSYLVKSCGDFNCHYFCTLHSDAGYIL